MANPTVVIDNGAGSIKLGFVGDSSPRKVMPAAIVKASGGKKYVGDELSSCPNFANLHFQQPCDRGYVVDWTALQALWEKGLGRTGLAAACGTTTLLTSEPPCCPPAIQKSMDQFVFECMGFAGYYTTRAARLASYAVAPTSPVKLIVDVGYSFTHATPVFDNFDLNYATKRVNIGGKLLTNQLKEVVSYRLMNMMNETYTLNLIKENLGYVALDFDGELQRSMKKNSEIARTYVLPDYQSIMVGFVEEESSPSKKAKLDDDEGPATLRINNERFTVPELLFNPSDIGLDQGGVADACAQAISACPTALQAPLWANICLVGGSVLFPGFQERLEVELRGRAPNECSIGVQMGNDPISAAWRGGAVLASRSDFADWVVTKEEYDEFGDDLCRRRFMA